jgi:hypothetical protein
MLWALGKVLAAAAAYGVLLWLGSRARRALAKWLVTVTALHTSKLQVGGVALIQRER